MKFKLGCLAFFVLIIGAPVLASKYLPWWGTLLFIAGEGALLLFGIPRLIKFAAKRFAMGLFTTKSRVLRGAMVQVHRVEPTSPPVTRRRAMLSDSDGRDDSGDETGDDIVDEGESDAPSAKSKFGDPGKRFVLIDFTLTPRVGQSRMQFWDPAELLLIPFDTKIRMDEDPTSSDRSGSIASIRLVDESGTETEDFDKITGPAHLRAVFSCPSALTGRVKMQYCFEGFGDVMLP